MKAHIIISITTIVSAEARFYIPRILTNTVKGAASFFGDAFDTLKAIGTNTEDEPHADWLPEGESVYDNARYNMNIAGMIYYYTELRAETKKRNLESYFGILEIPKDMATLHDDLVDYDQEIINPLFRLAFGGTEFNRKNVKDLIPHDDNIIVHKIDDEFNSSTLDIDGIVMGLMSEIVWAIVINKTKKKITVVFRGSTNLSDWVTNIRINMEDCVLPGYTSEKIVDKGKYGRVHEGFYHYLFGKTKKGKDGRSISKGEEIVGELVGLLAKPQYAGFNIEVTGHSLGGSLSTLFAFRCACLGDFGDATITNVSFASPFVGDDEFRKKFIELERRRKILHLRISNYQDVFPLIPAVTFPHPRRGFIPYKHVGMNIRLYDRGWFKAAEYRLFYSKDDDKINDDILKKWSVNFIGKHLLPEYSKRLEYKETKKQLQKLSLQKLYQDKEITGWDFYETKK